jgi:hypothetical protein
MGTTFEDVHRDRITGSLTMFDRLIFKGHLNRLYAPGAVRRLLWYQGVPITKFAAYVKEASDALVAHAEAIAAAAGRPSIYLARSMTRDHGRSKEDLLLRARLERGPAPLWRGWHGHRPSRIGDPHAPAGERSRTR